MYFLLASLIRNLELLSVNGLIIVNVLQYVVLAASLNNLLYIFTVSCDDPFCYLINAVCFDQVQYVNNITK